MEHARRARFAALALVVTAWAASPSAQIPRETSLYELVDAGPVAPPASCSCIARPFSVPYHPQPSPGPSARAAQRYAAERAEIGRHAQQGLDGNPNASLSVAMHLAVEPTLAPENPRTEEETVRWLHLAAQQEHPDAFRLLGHRYARGRGVAQDDRVAAYWFDQGARRGDSISMTALGLLFAAGRGVRQDWQIALRWWERAQARTPLAARLAADAYACGVGTAQDYARAAATYTSVADREPSASIQLGHMIANRCAEGGDEAAVTAFERAADEGFPEAQIALSDLVRQGRGTALNPYRAYTLARLAELRLPAGDLRTLASERVKSAVRLTTPEALEAQERLVQAMIGADSRPVR